MKRIALFVLILSLLFLIVLILVGTSHAHSFYSQECCQDKDCRPVPCAEITSTQTGWTWKDRIFSTGMFRVSPDGLCHVCYGIVPRCIYLPPAS